MAYLEELKHIGDHDRHHAGRRPDDAGDRLQLLLGRLLHRWRLPIRAQLNLVAQRAHVRPDELERLFQGVGIPETRIQDMAAETNSRQQCRIIVDTVDGVEHRLGALDPLLALDRSADLQLSDNIIYISS